MKICILSCYNDLMLKDTGPSIRTYYLAENLAMLGHEVHIIIPGDKVASERIDKLVIHRIKGLYPKRFLDCLSSLLGVSRSLSLLFYDFLFILRASRIIQESEIIQIEQPWAGGFMPLLITKVFKKTLVIDSHDVFQALRIGRPGFLRKVLEIFLEKMAYKCADTILVVSEKDREFLTKSGFDQDKVVPIPNGVDTETFTPLFDATDVQNRYDLKGFHTVVFVGNMEYLPNQEAVHVIASNLAPMIQKKVGNVKFVIVGRTPPTLHYPNLIFTGVVENVAKFLAASDVAIAPLFHGSGSRLKIVEYFSCGLPVVSTKIGVEGLEVKNGVNALIEDDMEKFATKVIMLLEDKELSRKLGKAARQLAINEYDWRKITKQLNSVYHTFLCAKRM